jgi:putative endopeptidase
MRTSILLLALAVLVQLSCSTARKDAVQDPLLSHIDSTVNPADDFFLYANGKWFKQNPIPPSEQSNGLWQLIQDTINAQVLNICQSASAMKDAPKGSPKQKIGDFFYSGMDSATLNARGMTDIQPDLARISSLKDIKGLLAEAAYIHTVSGAPMFNIYVGQDDRISSKHAIFILQGGLSLPDRSFYVDNDPRTVMIREKFTGHLARMYGIMGMDEAQAKKAAEQVMKIETALAKASRKREDTRDPLKNYNKMPFAKLKASTPGMDWDSFMAAAGLKNVDTVIVGQPEFLASENGMLKSFPLEDWKNYLKYHLVKGLARFLDDKTYLESFSFYSTVLRGVQEPKPRWKRVVEQTDRSLGELIGQVYVDEYLPKGTKEKLQEIGKNIMDVYGERIRNLEWMSPETKEKALKKLGTVIIKVGYPDKWKDLSTLTVDRLSYVKNGMSANLWDFAYNTSKFGKPVDRTEWGMQPQNYNAYYNPSNNEIVIPGCNIIVPGYERVMADDALLYSIIGGSTFGHEITHGFDDQGCKYDENGNLQNWWTKDDSSKFFSRTRLIVEQFNAYVPVDSLHINGELTQGENIADLAGVIIGYEAFKKTKQYKDKEMIAGLSPDQRFFLGYALAWMINMRPEAIANQVKSDEHSPAKYRVIGPLSNMPEFYATFGVKPGNAMYRPDSLIVRIW